MDIQKTSTIPEVHKKKGIKMNIIKYPSEERYREAINDDEPFLLLVSFDGNQAIVSPIDESLEHHILLEQVGLDSRDIDKFFRVVVDENGADWTFVCPQNYKNITIKDRRIKQFYKDGIEIITICLKELGFNEEIDIPKRYRRHFDYLFDDKL